MDYPQERGFLLLKTKLRERDVKAPTLVANWIYLTLMRRLTYEAREGGKPGVLTSQGLSLLLEEFREILGGEQSWRDLLEEAGLVQYQTGSTEGLCNFYIADGMNRGHGNQYAGVSSKGGHHSAVARRRRKTDQESQELALGLVGVQGEYHDSSGQALDAATLKELVAIIKTLDNCFEFTRAETREGYKPELVASAFSFHEEYGHMVLEYGRRRMHLPLLTVMAYFLLDRKGDPSVPKSTEQVFSLKNSLVSRVRIFASTSTRKGEEAA